MFPLALGYLIVAAAALPILAAAQAPLVQPAQPAAPKTPAAAPRTPISPRLFDDLEQALSFPKFQVEPHPLQLMELENELRFGSTVMELQHKLDFDFQFAQEAQLLQQQVEQLDLEQLRIDAEHIKLEAEALAHSALMKPPKIESLFGRFGAEQSLNARPRPPWASADPADSLYRVAREALNRGEYRRAAQMFNELVKKFPRSEYAIDSQYWEAFARYRAGGTDDLREAIRILDEGRVQLAGLRKKSNVDVQALRARIQAALAARGDAKAAEDLKREASQSNGSCDREEVSVRAEALSALGQMDPAAAKPAIRKVLQRRDECTVELRRRALYLVGRQADGDAAATILDVARNDPDAGIRGEALRWLPRVAGDNAVPQLEDMLRTASNEQTQRSIVYALASIDSDRARRAVRAIIERNDAAERVRYDAIVSLSREKEGRINADDMAYLRGLYGKLEPTRLKQAVIESVSRASTPESERFLLAIARNTNESPSLRGTALQRLARMNAVSVADIAKLYDSADARALREQILSALSQRKEPEAIDKMMEIARKDTDPQIRRYAISLLSRSNNERAKKLLQEMIDQ